MSHVVITQNRVDIGVAISDALAGIALEPLVADKIVAVKPNETRARHHGHHSTRRRRHGVCCFPDGGKR
jgi:hypothetical protein